MQHSRKRLFLYWIGFAIVFFFGSAMLTIGPSPGSVSVLYIAAALGAYLKRRNSEHAK